MFPKTQRHCTRWLHLEHPCTVNITLHSVLTLQCASVAHTVFTTKCILHWERMKLCTRQGLCTNLNASLLNFLVTAISHLSRSPGVEAKLEASSLATRPPICYLSKDQWNEGFPYCSAVQMVAFLLLLGWESIRVAARRELDPRMLWEKAPFHCLAIPMSHWLLDTVIGNKSCSPQTRPTGCYCFPFM